MSNKIKAMHTAGAFGYRMEFAIPHNPISIANKPNSKRVQRAIMLKEFMESK